MRFLILTDIHDRWAHLDKILQMASDLDGVLFLGDLMAFRKVTSKSLTNFSRIHDAADWIVGVPGNGALPEVVQYLSDIGINIHGASRLHNDIAFFGVGGVPNTVNKILELRTHFKENPEITELDSMSVETLNAFGIYIQNEAFEVEEWGSKEIREIGRYSSPFEHTESEIFNTLLMANEPIRNIPIRVLLSHVPPNERGIKPALHKGVTIGSNSLAKFIQENQPSIALSGHYHLHHEFSIGSCLCAVIPAVMDGYYSILTMDSSIETCTVKIERF